MQTDDWNRLSDLIRAHPGKQVPIVVERGGHDVTLHAKIATNQVAKKDSHGQIVQASTSRPASSASAPPPASSARTSVSP